MDEVTEQRLVNSCKGGDRTAYGTLVKRYSRSVLAVCLGIIGNGADAEDAGQEAFVRGFVEIARLRDGELFGPWILSISRNLSIDFLRRQKIGRAVIEKQVGKCEESTEDYSALETAIGRLEQKYREVLIMYYFDGKNTESVAAKLEIAPATVLTRMSRARKMLRDILSRQGVNNG